MSSTVIPYLLCTDVGAELDWLERAFGFETQSREPGSDGAITHAQMDIGGAVIMFGNPGDGFRNPRELGHATQLQFVTVDDVDAHHRRAVESGARIVADLDDRDYGRSYGADDPEGHRWYFTAGA